MNSSLKVSSYVKNTFFKLDEIIVVFHPYTGNTYKLEGIRVQIFEILLTRSLAAHQVIKLLTRHHPGINDEDILALLKELKTLELVQ